MIEHHTGDHLKDVIEEILKNFKIEPFQISAIVIDNGSNIVSACKKLAVSYLNCFAHTLQLAIKNGTVTL